MAGFLLFRPNLTTHAQTATPPYFGIATEQLDAAQISTEFALAKEAGLTGLVISYQSVELLEAAVLAANANEMQILLFTDQSNPAPLYTHYANEPAFALFQQPRLLTTLDNYRINTPSFDGVMWAGTTQLTEIPESLTAAKKIVDEMFALRRRIQQSGHLWTVVISADTPDFPTEVTGALAVAPDAVVVADWLNFSAEIRAEVEKPRTTLADFNRDALAYASAPSKPYQRFLALGGVAVAMLVGGVIVARKELT